MDFTAAGLKAHDEVKRASSRINANAAYCTVHRPSVQSVEWSRDPTTGDDLVITETMRAIPMVSHKSLKASRIYTYHIAK